LRVSDAPIRLDAVPRFLRVIQGLRAEFVSQLISCRVPFVLQVRREYEDMMTGIHTSDRFDELDRVLNERYESVHEGHIYRLLRLKQSDTTMSDGKSGLNFQQIRH
jgi:hypothetical protein